MFAWSDLFYGGGFQVTMGFGAHIKAGCEAQDAEVP